MAFCEIAILGFSFPSPKGSSSSSCFEKLPSKSFSVKMMSGSFDFIKKGLKTTKWAARLEYKKEKNILIDGAHNPDSALELRKSLDFYFKNEKNLLEIKKLISLGVQIVYEDSRSVESELSGKKIVLTGTLSLWSRDEASEKIRKLGGITVSSVSKQTDFCLAGENAGSKLDKAKALGVKILTEDEFKKIIEKYNI